MQILLKFIVNKDFLSGLENQLECHSAFIEQGAKIILYIILY